MIENFDNYEFRCSSLGDLLTDPRSKKEALYGCLGATCISKLDQIFDEAVYGFRDKLETKPMEKGILCEEDSLQLASDITGQFLKKNTERKGNGIITGLPDVTKPFVLDTKSSWSRGSFLRSKPSDYIEQLNGYMWLFDQTEGYIAFCLVPAPPHQIAQAQRSLHYKVGFDEDSDEYQREMDELEESMTFSKIPFYDRIKLFPIERDQVIIDKIQERHVYWRMYLNNKLIVLKELKLKYEK